MAAATGTTPFINPETGDTYYMPTDVGGGSFGGFGGFGGGDSGGFGGGAGGEGGFQFFTDPGVRADYPGSFPGDFSPNTPIAPVEGKTYQSPYLDTNTGRLGADTSFNPNIGAPEWLKSLLGIASVLPTPIQPLAAAANVVTNLYDANARGTSLVPSLSGLAGLAGQPLLAAGLGAYGQYEQGNTIGAGLSGLGILGAATGNPELGQIAGQVGSGLNAYNALQRGDYLGAATAAAGAADPSIAREANAVNTIAKGMDSGNMTAVLSGATALTGSGDLALATQASKLLDSAAKNDWGVVSDLASNIKRGTSDVFAGMFQPGSTGNISDIGSIFAPQGGFAPGELDRDQMAVGPRDPVGYVPDAQLISDYDVRGGSGSSAASPAPAPVAAAPSPAPSPAPAPVAAAPTQDSSELVALLLGLGLMDTGGQSPIVQQTAASAPMPAFDVNSMFLSSYLGDKNRQPRTVAELLQSLRTA
jgi:hypothetical protein